MPGWLRTAVVLAAAGFALWWVLGHGVDPAAWRRAWAGRSALASAAVFVGVYAAATVALLPVEALSLAAGAVFGPVFGVGLVWTGAMIGAAGAFALGRTMTPVRVRLAGSRRLARFDALVRRRGTAAVLVVRLVPLFPFGWVNYAAAFTAVGWRGYLVGTGVGILPGTVAYVALGGALTRAGTPVFFAAIGLLLAALAGGSWLARRGRSRSTDDAPLVTVVAEDVIPPAVRAPAMPIRPDTRAPEDGHSTTKTPKTG